MPEVPCPHCGTRLNAPDDLIGSQVTCGQCQKVFVASTSATPPGPDLPYTRPGPPPPPMTGPMALADRTSGYAIASMVLGIVSIPACTCYGVPGIICGILALVFAGISRRAVEEGRAGGSSGGMAKAGKICGICGIIVPLLFWTLYILGVIWFFSQSQSWF